MDISNFCFYVDGKKIIASCFFSLIATALHAEPLSQPESQVLDISAEQAAPLEIKTIKTETLAPLTSTPYPQVESASSLNLDVHEAKSPTPLSTQKAGTHVEPTLTKPANAAASTGITIQNDALGLDVYKLPMEIAEAFARAKLPPEAIGTLVQEVGNHIPLIESNTTTPYNPASTMKLVTTSAAIDILSPTFTWKTEAYALGKMRGNTLHGNLLIKGSGDPKFVYEDLWRFLRKLRGSGLRKIRGNLILDRSLFKDQAFDPAAFDDEPLKAYNAGPDALLLNFKVLQFNFKPDMKKKRVYLNTTPPIADYIIDSPFLSNDACGQWKKQLLAMHNSKQIRFNGAFPAACGEKTWVMHQYMMSNNQYFHHVFKSLWESLGGKFDGGVKDGVAPEDATPLLTWTSDPLHDIVKNINKFSNNVMARQLLLTIAAQNDDGPATPEKGERAIQEWLILKGVMSNELIIENGSGLSRTARISAETLAEILLLNWHSPFMPEIMSSLPITGMDGTMKKRAENMGVAGRSHIKTGSLKGVRAMAGYVLAASGKRYVVVNLINHEHARRSRIAQDALLQWIYENG